MWTARCSWYGSFPRWPARAGATTRGLSFYVFVLSVIGLVLLVTAAIMMRYRRRIAAMQRIEQLMVEVEEFRSWWKTRGVDGVDVGLTDYHDSLGPLDLPVRPR